jgi:hypothetical protein
MESTETANQGLEMGSRHHDVAERTRQLNIVMLVSPAPVQLQFCYQDYDANASSTIDPNVRSDALHLFHNGRCVG